MRSIKPSSIQPLSVAGKSPSGSNGAPRVEKPSPDPELHPTGLDPYRAVVLAFLAASLIGTIGAVLAGQTVADPVLFDVAITLGISTGILAGVAVAQAARAKHTAAVAVEEVQAAAAGAAASRGWARWKIRLTKVRVRVVSWAREIGATRLISLGTAAAGVLAIIFEFLLSVEAQSPTPLVAEIGAAICLVAAGLAATAAHYLRSVDPARLSESSGLRRGARVLAWILVLAAASMSIAWAGWDTVLQILHYLLVAINIAACYGLVWARRDEAETVETFPLDLEVLSVLGSRTNIVGSVLDAAERQLGIDLRSTWALTVVRRSVEPLAIGLCLVAWLSTSFTVVGTQEEGLVERLGVAVGGDPLQPGLHLHWPWPIDRVFRIPVKRIQATTVGHEGKEERGPENVLWAVQHAANEYTLLLGNGRDLITVDATVQYRIVDARAWRYHSRNPADALRAIAHRAVMRSTVNRTLAEALSENVAVLTAQMRDMVQQDADALGLGVEVVAFTLGGMHPPVAVAPAYQAVVSAEIAKVTAVVDAQAFHNRTVPAAEASVVSRENTARADGINALARAAGEAWSFRTMESQFRAAPQEYFFRRRLETLENGLSGLQFTVVDSRFQRDGGELWLIP